MIEGFKHNNHSSNRYKKNSHGYIRKSQTFYQGKNKKKYSTVIETIIDDTNKENEPKDFNESQILTDKKNIESTDVSKSSTINVSTDCLKEAFYFPKKLATVYKLFASSKAVTQSYKPELLRTYSIPVIKHSDNLRIDHNTHNIECDNDNGIYDHYSHNSLYNKDQYGFCFIQQQQYGMILNAMNIQRRAFDHLSQEQMLMKENTEILSIKVKVSENQFILCKIRRFDDLFMTIKIFCEINQIDSQLIRPLILEVFIALNSIYLTFNAALTQEDIKYLNQIRSFVE